MTPARWLAAAALAACATAAMAERASEPDLKAAFVVNLAGFVDWPPPRPGEPAELVACVPAHSSLRGPLATLAGEPVAGRTLRVVALPRGGEPATCHLLVVQGPPPPGVRAPLTMLDSTELSPTPYPVTFAIVDQRLRFRVNLAALREARLAISSKALRLAHAVDGS